MSVDKLSCLDEQLQQRAVAYHTEGPAMVIQTDGGVGKKFSFTHLGSGTPPPPPNAWVSSFSYWIPAPAQGSVILPLGSVP